MILADFPAGFLRVCALLFGLTWGSFLNVVIHRLPREMSIVRPASHCPSCGRPIKVVHNIPVLSWLLMGGRARCCGAKVSVRYLLVELAGGVLSLAVLERMVLTLPGSTTAIHGLVIYLAHLALVLALTAAAFIDLEHMIVPDSISIGGTILGVATFSLRNMTIFDAAIGAVAGFFLVWLPFCVLYPRLRGKVGMGLGDAKLVMLAGGWFGWQGAVLVLCAGAIQGTLAALVVMVSGKHLEEPEAVKLERAQLQEELESLPEDERAELQAELLQDPLAAEPDQGWSQARIAFGPFLILAILECLFLGRDRIVGWLLQA